MPPSNAARKSCVTKNKGEVPKKTLRLLVLTDTMLKTKVELRFQSKVVPNMVGVLFGFVFFYFLQVFIFGGIYGTLLEYNISKKQYEPDQ